MIPQRMPAQITDPVVGLLSRTGVTPNMLTVAGFLGNCIAAYFAAAGAFVIAGAIMLLFSMLDAFDGALRTAYEKRAPHFLAEHAYGLAQAFSGFYTHCPILPSEGAIRASRLALAAATLKQLTLTLDLLGIAVPERM